MAGDDDRLGGMKIARGCGGALALVLGVGAASGQSGVAEFFARAGSERVDIVGIGDSNQLFQNFGWEAGLLLAVAERFPVYSTGLLSPGEAGGGGGVCGHTWFGFGAGTAGGFQTSGAPAQLGQYLNSASSGLFPPSYQYVPSGVSVPGPTTHGLFLDANSLIGSSGPLRFEVTYGRFAGTQLGSFTPTVRLSAPTYQILASSPPVFTRGDAWGVAVDRSLTLPAGDRPSRLEFRFAHPFGTIDGPFIGYWMRVENTDRISGVSVQSLYGNGGQSARDMAAALIASSDATLSLYFTGVRSLSGGAVLARIASGLNDQSEPLPSVGPGQVADGTSPAAYDDNLRAMMARISEVWTLNGWPAEDLFFEIVPPHPFMIADPPVVAQYRQVATAIAASNPRTAVTDFLGLTTYAEMVTNGWYATPGDTFHLSPAGYTELTRRELAALLGEVRCRADIDRSGGVDSDDVIAFFSLWDANQMDYNEDGGTDGDDIIAFFAGWDAGC